MSSSSHEAESVSMSSRSMPSSSPAKPMLSCIAPSRARSQADVTVANA